MMAEVETSVNPDAVFTDGLIFLRRDWPVSGLWSAFFID